MAEVTLNPRYVGDDWTIVATTDDDVSDWDVDTLAIQIRRGPSPRAEIMASTESDPATIVTSGSEELGVPATAFAADGGTLSIHVPRATTATLSEAPYATVEASVIALSLGGRKTVMRATMPVYDSVTVEG